MLVNPVQSAQNTSHGASNIKLASIFLSPQSSILSTFHLLYAWAMTWTDFVPTTADPAGLHPCPPPEKYRALSPHMPAMLQMPYEPADARYGAHKPQRMGVTAFDSRMISPRSHLDNGPVSVASAVSQNVDIFSRC